MKTALFALALPLFAASAAVAMPLAAPAPVASPIEQVQMRCDQNSCIDLRTGVYTKSGCDRRGCYPISGPRGQIGAYGQDYRYSRGRDYDDGYYRRRDYYGRRGYDGGYGPDWR
ncbi:hypothetical protein ACWIGM_11225 [Bosea sp. NPDC055332]